MDHCHLTGKYSGAAHSTCNLRLRIRPEVPITAVLHNLKWHDEHLLLPGYGKNVTKGSKLYSKQYGKVHQLFNGGREGCVLLPTLISCKRAWIRWWEACLQSTPRCLQKNETQSQPIRQKVFVSIRMEGSVSATQNCPPKTYFATRWMTSTRKKCSAGAFENFRSICLKQYKLDPALYYTSPSLFWDVMLKKTGEVFELLTDVDMHLFVREETRGRILMISKRSAKANNPYVKKTKTKKTKLVLTIQDKQIMSSTT